MRQTEDMLPKSVFRATFPLLFCTMCASVVFGLPQAKGNRDTAGSRETSGSPSLSRRIYMRSRAHSESYHWTGFTGLQGRADWSGRGARFPLAPAAQTPGLLPLEPSRPHLPSLSLSCSRMTGSHTYVWNYIWSLSLASSYHVYSIIGAAERTMRVGESVFLPDSA